MSILEILIIGFITSLVFLMGTLHGWNLRERHAERRLQAFSAFVEKRLEEEIENMIPITIEKHNDMLFVYNKEDNSFMAQGKDRVELEKALHTRYPDKKFACDHETLVKIGFVS